MNKNILIALSLSTLACACEYEDGLKYYQQSQYTKAKECFEQISNTKSSQSSKAMLAIGVMYNNGDGVNRDINKSIKWFEKSALKGNMQASNKLGNYYASKEKYKQSFKWFEKSALKGNSEASFYLGYFYTGGLGVDRDLSKSMSWYEKSALKDNSKAQLNLAFMYIGGQGTKVDYAKASYWAYKAKKLGNPKANIMIEEFKLDEYKDKKKDSK